MNLGWWLSAKHSVHLLCTISGKEEITDDINYELNPRLNSHLLSPHPSPPQPLLLLIPLSSLSSLTLTPLPHPSSSHPTLLTEALHPRSEGE